jgi:hypothetical protein
MKRVIAIALAAGLTPTVVAARDLRVATWNLGWHLSQAEAQVWIDRCGTPFAFNEAASRWEPAASGTPGWQLRWARDAPILWDLSLLPPCDVFQANFRIVPATPEAYRRRSGQIGTVLGQRVDPDVIAFQEVSGEQAVREILPDGGTGYHVCSFQDFKVQRLAFAWRRELGDASEPCSVNEALSAGPATRGPGEAGPVAWPSHRGQARAVPQRAPQVVLRVAAGSGRRRGRAGRAGGR